MIKEILVNLFFMFFLFGVEPLHIFRGSNGILNVDNLYVRNSRVLTENDLEKYFVMKRYTFERSEFAVLVQQPFQHIENLPFNFTNAELNCVFTLMENDQFNTKIDIYSVGYPDVNDNLVIAGTIERGVEISVESEINHYIQTTVNGLLFSNVVLIVINPFVEYSTCEEIKFSCQVVYI